ncbi:hypothetical protein GCM10023203_19680 [Actinomycetospora straminea]|uniref:Uncharacterized protein n=1 Tax=Actinomycetospora straminea TaxID=663607 RepID=A0ABP9EEW7_9PSEU
MRLGGGERRGGEQAGGDADGDDAQLLQHEELQWCVGGAQRRTVEERGAVGIGWLNEPVMSS